MRRTGRWALGTTILAVACGRGAPIAQGSTTSSSSGGGTTSSATSTAEGSSSGGGGSGGGQACDAAAEGIAQAATGAGSCTSVVRLDYASLAVLGFQLACGPYAKPAEADARAAAQKDTGFGQTGTAAAGDTPSDDFVFVVAASDFGGSAAVSAHTGLSVFGGSTVWAGKGDITYPKAWRPAADLGLGCGQTGIPMPPARGFDLASGAPLPSAQVNAALAKVWETALPAGLAKVAYLIDAMVLLYPRSVGAFDPTTAEWIVLIGSEFLE
jgi:hypothetical protein